VITDARGGDRPPKPPSSLELETVSHYDDRGDIVDSFHLEKEGKASLSLALSIL
jgi:hypothetical protein